MFNLNVTTSPTVLADTGMSQQQLNTVLEGIQQATQLWGRYIDAPTANIDLSLDFRDLPGNVLAEAGATYFSFDGGATFDNEVIEELNGNATPFDDDASMTIDTPKLLNGSFFFSDDLDYIDQPGGNSGQTDFLTLVTHELGHALGFNSFDYSGMVSNGTFTGANAVAENGGPVALASDNVHLAAGNVFQGDDLMSPSIANNIREFISPLHVAMLKDFGVPIATASGTANTLYGFHENDDTLSGLGGNDKLFGLTGTDTLNGDGGDDRLDGGLGSDTINGGLGNDSLVISSSVSGDVDTLNGGADTDTAVFEGFKSGVWVRLNFTGNDAWTRDRTDIDSGTWRGIADLVSIENLSGSSFEDYLAGDASRNVLVGGTGDDKLFGLAGNDVLQIGANNVGDLDLLDGGTGQDVADFTNFASAVWVNLNYNGNEAWTRDAANVDAGVWRDIGNLNNIEDIVGSTFNDYLSGDNSDNTLNGGAGIDELFGLGGNDILSVSSATAGQIDQLDGGADTDIADFSDFTSAVWVNLGFSGTKAWTRDGDDVLSGTWREIAEIARIEGVTGTQLNDYISGDNTDNILNGLGGSDRLFGRGGDDRLSLSESIGSNFDLLDGGADTDTAVFSDFGSAVWVNLSYSGSEAWTRDNSGVASGTWRDIANLNNIENIEGSNFADFLSGDANANTINGMAGNDILIGEGGADIFDFSDGFGLDTINDFEDGIDIISFANLTTGINFGNLTIDQTGNDATITFNDTDIITLVDIQSGTLSDQDFMFV